MNGLRRFFKKLFIVLILLAVIGGIVFLLTKPKQDMCFDKRQDNGETGIDCGGFCGVCPNPDKPEGVQAVKINWAKSVEDGRNNYDFVASLSNENASWGVASVNYEFVYYDEGGNVIGKKQGVTSIMPKGNTTDSSLKYIIEDNVDSSVQPYRTDLVLSNYRWEQVISPIDVDNLNENVIKILATDFRKDNVIKSYLATGTTKNTSKYDFVQVDINVVVLGKNDELIAAAKTNQNTLRAGDGWGFTVVWPNLKLADKSQVDHVDYRAETNVFLPNNFMKEYRSSN